MITKRIDLWKPEEYTYPLGFGFIPNIMTVLHEDDITRPAMLVVPGGAYMFCSPSEARIVANRFYRFGFNCFVLTYTVNTLQTAPVRDQALRDASRAIRMIRRDAADFHVDAGRVAIVGFSAGGHLSASVCTLFDTVKEDDPTLAAFSNRPDAAVLSYPVITAGKYTHQGSADALLGFNPSEEDIAYWSLENQVTENTPPTFLWHTITDEAVPVENSLMYEAALRAHGVPHAMHLFSEGRHGLSLADEAWASGIFGDPHTLEPTLKQTAAVIDGTVTLPPERMENFLQWKDAHNMEWRETIHPEVMVWPELARDFLKARGILK